MKCEICDVDAVISTNNGTLCTEHFKHRFEEITIDTIKRYGMIREGETIAVANSGGKDSLSLLFVLNKHFKDKNKIVSITVDEGITGYRDKTIETMKHYCSEWSVEYKIYSYKDYSGSTMDEITRVKPGIPCATCGVFRRHILNASAVDTGADKIATAHNLDDEAENVMMNLFQNDFDKLVRLGPFSGIRERSGFVPRIKPFMFLSEKETMLFSIVNGIDALHTACPYAGLGFRGLISRKVKEIESARTGSKRAMVDRMLEIKKKYASAAEASATALRKCASCGSPSSKDTCEACVLKTEISAVKRGEILNV